jgi:biotin carboxyl carrier protein
MAELTDPEARQALQAREIREVPEGPEPPPPPPAGARRLDVRASMGLDQGPWTVVPGDPRTSRVHRFDGTRARIEEGAASGEDPIPVVTARPSAVGRSGQVRHEIVVGGWRVLVDVEDEGSARLRERARRGREDAAHAGPLEVRAIIPGRVVAVSVAEGDTVESGQQLLVIEAMKMQNELRSPRAGVVERIAAGVGQAVELGAVLLVLR